MKIDIVKFTHGKYGIRKTDNDEIMYYSMRESSYASWVNFTSSERYSGDAERVYEFYLKLTRPSTKDLGEDITLLVKSNLEETN